MKFTKRYGQFTFSVESKNHTPKGAEIYIECSWFNPVCGGGRSGSTEVNFIGVNSRINEWLGKLLLADKAGDFNDHPEIINYAAAFAKEAKEQDYFP